METINQTVTADALTAGSVAVQESIPAVATVSTKAFVAELEWAARFANKKSTIPILQNVAIQSLDGEIRLQATDLESGAVTSVDSEGDSFAITVPAHLALKYLKKVSESEITLTVQGTSLTIRHGADSEVKLNGMSMESFPELPAVPMFSNEFRGLAAALPRIITSISSEESRFTLNGALLEVRDGAARLVSTDGHRLSLCTVECEWHDAMRAILPRFALAELAMLKVDSAHFGFDENHAFIRSGSRTIITRKLTGQFPDYERVMPKNYPHVATIDADALRKHGERVALFCDERSKAMLFTMADSKLTISNSASENGKAKASIATTWEVPEWTTGLNWSYVLDFLKMSPKTAFDLRFTSEGSEKTGHNVNAVVFHVPGWEYVVMPMRI